MSDRPDNMDGETSDEIIAGEYVLGVLSVEDRRRVERRIMQDQGFALRVRRWQDNLESLDENYGEIRPPMGIFGGIEMRLFGEETDDRTSVFSTLWSSVAFWRGAAFATIMAGIGLAIVMNVMQPGTGRPLPVVAELSATKGGVNLVASYDPGTGLMRITPAGGSLSEPKSLELWLIEDGKTPLSLGVFEESGKGEMIVPIDVKERLTSGMSLAVTVEPVGGSKIKGPSGPVVAAGLTLTP